MSDSSVSTPKVIDLFSQSSVEETARSRSGGSDGSGGGTIEDRVTSLEMQMWQINQNVKTIGTNVEAIKDKIGHGVSLREGLGALAFITVTICGLYMVINPLMIRDEISRYKDPNTEKLFESIDQIKEDIGDLKLKSTHMRQQKEELPQ